jgi:predicted nucleic acid-binding protein
VILVDTSVWVDHLHSGNEVLATLLGRSAVLAHPWVTGELALGNLRNREEVLGLLRGLPQAIVAEDAEVLHLIEDRELHAVGIGYVDAQLLAAGRLTPDTRVWTKDKRLANVAGRLELAFDPADGSEAIT